jgi:hypothetical protein
MGTSNQKCNEYYIELKDVKGSVVESGNSIAKNGAYETRLEVADGYSYSIRYNYISPCRDTGTASSRFDVKPNTVNYVRVETPRCETN